MKLKVIAAVIMAGGMATAAFGQGILANNTANNGGISATTGGQVFVEGVIFDGTTYNLGVTISGGPDAGSLAPIGLGTYTFATDPKGYTGDSPGHFALGNGVLTVPGLAPGASSATIKLDIWFDGVSGLFANYGAAFAGGGKVGSITWVNAVGNPLANPPAPPAALDQMPSVNLVIAPEPSTLALAGLGVASLLLFRRRN